MFDINVPSTVRATRAALPSLIERRGAIVNVSSTLGRMPAGSPASYGSAKAALTTLGKSLAEEFGPCGVRVNTVSPGMVRTTAIRTPAARPASSPLQPGRALPTSCTRFWNPNTSRPGA